MILIYISTPYITNSNSCYLIMKSCYSIEVVAISYSIKAVETPENFSRFSGAVFFIK